MVRTGPSRPFDISATPSASRPGTPRTITEGTAVIPAKVRSKPPTSSFSLSPSTARAPVSPVSKTIICQPAAPSPGRAPTQNSRSRPGMRTSVPAASSMKSVGTMASSRSSPPSASRTTRRGGGAWLGAGAAGEARRLEATGGVLDVDLHVVGVVQVEDGPRLALGGEDQFLASADERHEPAGAGEDGRHGADEGRGVRP